MGRRPLTLKCPKCMRGKYSYPPKVKGLRALREREKRRHNVGRGTCHRGKVECLDCGHVWFSTHPTAEPRPCWRGDCVICKLVKLDRKSLFR